MTMTTKFVELLAPAGRYPVLEAAIKAGADAVYLGGKRFNMRMHRSDFNFTNEELVTAVDYAHSQGVKIYVVVNNLLYEPELDPLVDYLYFLRDIGVDAIIVQDLGLIRLIREEGLPLKMHASTMMNVHNIEGARVLAELGISRIITSRDITLAQVKEIFQATGLELEYFIHGDMCISQSGQCLTSGILSGKSSNRGRCLKPCRWRYTLVDNLSGQPITPETTDRYLLAMKDLCLYRHIPDLIEAGICSFKIEGRMRPPEFIARIVAAYRKAIDGYLSDPQGYFPDPQLFEELYRQRVREFSTCFSFKQPGRETIDTSGRREPLFLSRYIKEQGIDLRGLGPFHPRGRPEPGEDRGTNGNRPELSVKVGSLEGAYAALEAGADRVYIGGEIDVSQDRPISQGEIKEIIGQAHDKGKKIGLVTPRITLERHLKEIGELLANLTELPDAILVHNLGALRLFKRSTALPLYADFSFNLLNSAAISLLNELQVKQVTPSWEASYEDIEQLASKNILPLEIIVHGTIPGMLLEHCLLGLHLTNQSSKDPCLSPCLHGSYALADIIGQRRPIIADQYCRNQILLAHDLACLPFLEHFCKPGISSLRIEAQYYRPSLIRLVTHLYRKALDQGLTALTEEEVDALIRTSPRKFTLGPYRDILRRYQDKIVTIEEMAAV